MTSVEEERLAAVELFARRKAAWSTARIVYAPRLRDAEAALESGDYQTVMILLDTAVLTKALQEQGR